MPPPTALHWPLLLLVAACGATREQQAVTPSLRTAGSAAWVAESSGLTVLLVGMADAEGQLRPVARAAGVRLRTDDDDSAPALLAFISAASADGNLVLRCAELGSHQVEVHVREGQGGSLEVRVTDAVGLESRILEFAIDYQLISEASATESFAPHLHPQPDTVAGDDAFHLPLAFLRAGAVSLALLPDTDHLAHHRRLAQALAVDPEGRTIRHGLLVQTVERFGEGAVAFRQGTAGAPVQGERLEFAHRLLTSQTAVPGVTLDQVVGWLWDRTVRPRAQRGVVPDAPRLSRVASLVATAAERRVVSFALGQSRFTVLDDPTASDPGPREASFGWDRQDLAVLHALGSHAAAVGDEELRQRVGDGVRLLLRAPRQSGLFPQQVRADPLRKRIEGHPARDASLLHTADAAWTGIWLLRTRRWLPEEDAEIGTAARELGRFLARSQLDSGAIPGWFEPGFLAPRRDRFFGRGSETASAALFLAELAAEGDQQAAAACWRALAFLAEESQLPQWDAPELAPLAESVPGSATASPAPASSFGLVLGALAAASAWELEPVVGSQRRGQAAALLDRFLSRLQLFQCVCDKPWLSAAMEPVGGIRCNNLDLSWSRSRTALAAVAFLRGYEITGKSHYLQRGAAALLAARVGSSEDLESAALALEAARIVRDRFGDAVVDLASGTAVGLDALWIQDVELTEDTISLRVLASDGPSQARVQIRGAPPVPGGYRVQCNGTAYDGLDPATLAGGIELAVQRVPSLAFLPPAEIAGPRPWQARASFSGELPADAHAWLELDSERGSLGTLPLRADPATGVFHPAEQFIPEGLQLGAQLHVRLAVRTGNLVRYEPTVGHRTITVAAMHCIDPGDDDEPLLSDPGPSRRERFTDGRESCRSLPAGSTATWSVPVPVEATRLRIQMLVHGKASFGTGDRTLRDAHEAIAAPRWIDLELTDRRMWLDGVLPLTVRAADGPLRVARIRHLGEGTSASVAGPSQPSTMAPGLRIAVVPVTLDDLPLGSSDLMLAQAFFGGRDYGVTPAPIPRRTAGSGATLLAAMSGGEAALGGHVLPPLAADVLAAELTAPGPALDRLAAAVREHARDHAIAGPVDLVVAVLGGAGNSLPTAPIPGVPPLALLRERSADGSFLSCGRLLGAVLTAGHGVPDLTPADMGAFGSLDLTSAGSTHHPAGLAGVQLGRLGWADRTAMGPGEIEVPALQEDRAFLALSPAGLLGRGDLLVEDRHGGPGEPGGGGRLLLAWELNARGLVLGGAGLPPCRPGLLRLSPDPASWPTPYHPGRPADLFAAPQQLDGRSVPALATPEGEAPWALSLHPSAGRHILTVRDLTHDLSDWHRSTWTGGAGPGPAAPMPMDLDLGDGGHLQVEGLLRVHPRRAGTLRGELSLPALRGLYRLFAVLRADASLGSAEIRVHAGAELARFTVGGGARVPLELDLPATASALVLEVRTGEAGGPTILLASCRLVPRQPALSVLTPSPTGPAIQSWSDGVIRTVTADLGGPGGLEQRGGSGRLLLELPAPLLPGRTQVRLRLGFAELAGPDTTARLAVGLRNRDGSWTTPLLEELVLRRSDGDQPCTTVLLEVPERPAEVGFLSLRLLAETDAPVLIQVIEIVRP